MFSFVCSLFGFSYFLYTFLWPSYVFWTLVRSVVRSPKDLYLVPQVLFLQTTTSLVKLFKLSLVPNPGFSVVKCVFYDTVWYVRSTFRRTHTPCLTWYRQMKLWVTLEKLVFSLGVLFSIFRILFTFTRISLEIFTYIEPVVWIYWGDRNYNYKLIVPATS